MKLTITMDLDNAVFAVKTEDGEETQERNGHEVGDILRDLADRACEDDPLQPTWAIPLFDSNGNRMGKAAINDEREPHDIGQEELSSMYRRDDA